MRRKTYLWPVAALLLGVQLVAGAQQRGIPDEVFYLMPSFGQGMVYFRGQAPAEEQLNICAVDQSLRYLDGNGTELEAAQTDHIVRVQIDTVVFLHYRDAFYRMYPVSSGLGVALRRQVRIIRDAKPGAYGTTSQTSSINTYSSLTTESGVYRLGEGTKPAYDISEEIFLYKGEGVYPFSRKTLKKLFPDKKEAIDAFFKSGNALPKTADEAQTLLAVWAQ